MTKNIGHQRAIIATYRHTFITNNSIAHAANLLRVKFNLSGDDMRRQVLLLDQSLTSSDNDDDDNVEGDCRRADIVDRPSTVAATESVNLARSIESKIRNKDYFCSYELFPTDVSDVYHR